MNEAKACSKKPEIEFMGRMKPDSKKVQAISEISTPEGHFWREKILRHRSVSAHIRPSLTYPLLLNLSQSVDNKTCRILMKETMSR